MNHTYSTYCMHGCSHLSTYVLLIYTYFTLPQPLYLHTIHKINIQVEGAEALTRASTAIYPSIRKAFLFILATQFTSVTILSLNISRLYPAALGRFQDSQNAHPTLLAPGESERNEERASYEVDAWHDCFCTICWTTICLGQVVAVNSGLIHR